MEEKLRTFKIIKDGYICEYVIKHDDIYDEFMEEIKNKYSKKVKRQKLNHVEMNPFGDIMELRGYDEVLNKKITSIPKRDIDGRRLFGGSSYANVTFDGITYPYIYKLLEYGFKISCLEDLNIWMNQNKKSAEKKDDVEEIIKRFEAAMKSSRNGIRYSNDEQIKNRNKLMNSYFKLIDFELINKMSLDFYEEIINNPLLATPKVSEELDKEYKKIKENTRIVQDSCFKDIINEKLDRAFQIEKGNQKTKK